MLGYVKMVGTYSKYGREELMDVLDDVKRDVLGTSWALSGLAEAANSRSIEPDELNMFSELLMLASDAMERVLDRMRGEGGDAITPDGPKAGNDGKQPQEPQDAR